MNIFEQASKSKLRFNSVRGLLSTENLWDVPLKSNTGFDLDTLAKSANATIKASGEESFVADTVSAANIEATLQLDILKHIISVKLAAAAAAKTASDRRAERDKLLGLLEKKQDAALEELSPEAIKARLAELG